jgi:L-ascorbate metabolism protein UlaG (beta-lactamase superfamily)
MIITYGGLEFFKIQSGNLTLVFNPVSRESKTKIPSPRFKTDIAIISTDHPDFNGVKDLSGKDNKSVFIIDGPGEYEVQDVFIKGYSSKTSYGGREKINTIYKVTIEGVNLCFLGALEDKNMPDSILGELEDIEILFTPIGGEARLNDGVGQGVLSASDAYKLSVKISPNVIIPMHYDVNGEKDSLKKFLKEEGIKDVKPIDKLTTKKSALAVQSGEIIVLAKS